MKQRFYLLTKFDFAVYLPGKLLASITRLALLDESASDETKLYFSNE